jgi:nucleoside-diphosphate-sugar epimerase
MEMKTLVTGATGYVGMPLAHVLADRGVPVRALFRSETKGKQLFHPRIERIRGEMHDREGLRHVVRGCETVYHLAACTLPWAKDPDQYHRVNVEGTKTLFEVARQAGVKKIVLTSTAGVMGPAPNSGTPVDEHTNEKPFLFSMYDKSKQEAEQMALSFVANDLEVVIVNPSRIYGPGVSGHSNPITQMVGLFKQGKWYFIPGDGTSQGNYVYIDNVVDGHIRAMEHGVSGERYILGGANVSYNDFFALLNQLTARNQKLYHIPVKALLAFAYGEVFLARTFGKKPLIVPEFVKKLSSNWNLSSQKAIQELGYSFLDLEAGLQKTLNWISR